LHVPSPTLLPSYLIVIAPALTTCPHTVTFFNLVRVFPQAALPSCFSLLLFSVLLRHWGRDACFLISTRGFASPAIPAGEGDRKARGTTGRHQPVAVHTFPGFAWFCSVCTVASSLLSMSTPSSTNPSVLLDDDNWQGFSALLISTLPPPLVGSSSGSATSSPPSQPSSTDSSGKFNSFALVGASFTGGGGSKRALLITQPRSKFDCLCLGLVGTNKFCIKERLSGALSCGTTRHETSKFEGSYDHCYVKYNEIQAHCTPTLNLEAFSANQIAALADRSFSLADWTTILDGIAVGDLPDWFPKRLVVDTLQEEEPALSFQQLSILSPTSGPAVLFDYKPSLSFDSSDSSIIKASGKQPAKSFWRNQVVPPELMEHVDHISGGLKKIKMAWSKPFHDIEAGYKLVVADLGIMHDNVKHLHSTLGDPTPLSDSARTVWAALDYLHVAYVDLAATTSDIENKAVTTLSDHLAALGLPDDFTVFADELRASQSQLDNRLIQMENLLRTHTNRFNNIRPVLERISTLTSAPSNHGSSKRLMDLEDKITSIELQLSNKDHDMVSLETISSLQEEVRLLKQHIVGSGITIGSQVFQSYEDFVIWIKTNLPPGRFGLFVDGHSLLDFFSFVGFLDAESVANSFHSSNKSGFKSMLETRVAASMQNYFPAPFGKVAGDKIEDSESLPGISDPDKFDNGSTGVRYKILRGMKDVSLQLESNIDKVLRNYPDAKQMARDLLLSSTRFVIDLLNFMSQDYNSWKLRGYTKREAWKMTCRSVHRILDDLQGARMSGRDAGDGSDLDRRTATYIWATAKAHEVMEDYLKYQFFEHPAIAAILARHLAATSVLPDENLSSKLQALEERVSTYAKKVDRLESKANLKKVHIMEPEATDPPSPSPSPVPARPKNIYRGGAQVRATPPHSSRSSAPSYLYSTPFMQLQPATRALPLTNPLLAPTPKEPTQVFHTQSISGFLPNNLGQPCVVVAKEWPSWIFVTPPLQLHCKRLYIDRDQAGWIQPIRGLYDQLEVLKITGARDELTLLSSDTVILLQGSQKFVTQWIQMFPAECMYLASISWDPTSSLRNENIISHLSCGGTTTGYWEVRTNGTFCWIYHPKLYGGNYT